MIYNQAAARLRSLNGNIRSSIGISRTRLDTRGVYLGVRDAFTADSCFFFFFFFFNWLAARGARRARTKKSGNEAPPVAAGPF